MGDKSAGTGNTGTANPQQFVDLTYIKQTLLSIAQDVEEIKENKKLEKNELFDTTTNVQLAAEGFSESATHIQRLLEDLARRPNNNSNTTSQNSASESVEVDDEVEYLDQLD